MGMFKLTATKTLDGIKSTSTESFQSWAQANKICQAYKTLGYTVHLAKVG